MSKQKNIILEDTVNPCPMCGSKRYEIQYHYEIWIRCVRCGKCGPKAEKLHDAIKKWNRMNDG
jgi:Zn ribbon nucleic-acid-binding protein